LQHVAIYPVLQKIPSLRDCVMRIVSISYNHTVPSGLYSIDKTVDRKYNDVDRKYNDVDRKYNDADRKYNDVDRKYNVAGFRCNVAPRRRAVKKYF